MVVKLFVLGNPGSGKSTITRHIVAFVSQERQQWRVTHFNDYRILHRKFVNDTDNSFWPDGHKGFIVKERSLYNTVLKTLEGDINEYYTTNDGLAIIEFARNSYEEAFQQFDPAFLKDSYILFLDTDIKTCIARTYERFLDAKTEDDYFVSEHVFEYYRHNKNREYLDSPFFKKQYEVKRVKIIENSGPISRCIERIDRYVTLIHDRERENSNDRENFSALVFP